MKSIINFPRRNGDLSNSKWISKQIQGCRVGFNRLEGIKKTSVGDRFYITIDVIRHLQGQCKSVKCAIKLE